MTTRRDTTPRLAPTNTPTGVDLDFTIPAWVDNAACSPDTAELFFPTSTALEAALPALTICQTCPVRPQCLTYAHDLETDAGRLDTTGVWGGQTEHNRRRIRNGQLPTTWVPPKKTQEAS